ncbi:hypothetical protein ABK040_005744 [Willaertia magna]
MVIQLYRYFVSTKNSPSLNAIGWRSRIQMEEKNLGYENVLVIDDSTQKSAFATSDKLGQHILEPSVNPRRELPVLEDGTVIVTDEGAIMQYLEECYSDVNVTLLPDPEKERDKYAEVLSLFHEALNCYSNSKDILDALIKDDKETLKSKDFKIRVQFWKKKMKDELKQWNELLTQREYLWPLISNSRLSAADCAFYPFLAILIRYGFDMKGLDNLVAYHQRVSKRDSVLKSKPSRWDSGEIEAVFATQFNN